MDEAVGSDPPAPDPGPDRSPTQGPDAVQELLRWAWDRQSVWSATADLLKRRLFRARAGSLVLTVTAAVLVTAAVQVAGLSSTWGRTLAATASVCATVVALLQPFTSRDRVEAWTRARSASESFKAEVHTFLAGVTPYRGEDRLDRLREALDAVDNRAADLADRTIGRVAEVRPLPDVHDVPSYIEERLLKQADRFYAVKAGSAMTKAGWFRAAQIGLAVLAALVSAAAAISGRQGLAAWLPVITTVGAAIAAHGAAHRFDSLALEYARTDHQLRRLLRDWRTAAGPASVERDDRLVAEAERVISIQNESWMVRNVQAVPGDGDQGAKP